MKPRGHWRAAETDNAFSTLILAADFSHLLRGRGVTLYAHTGENAMRLHQEPIPCRLREATFVLDGLMEHDTEVDPWTVYTDTHGYTEVVMATAALLGKSLAPRIARMHEQTLYKLDRAAVPAPGPDPGGHRQAPSGAECLG